MKKLFIGAMTVAAMASCSQNKIVESSDSEKPVAIEFSKSQFGNSIITKADAAVKDVFIVSAFKGADAYDGITNQFLTKKTNWGLAATVDGEHQTHYYPVDGTAINFLSYRQDDAISEPTIAADGITMTATLDKDMVDKDLVVTETAATGSKNAAPITLNHVHTLSRMQFDGEVINGTGWTVSVESIKVNGLSVGTYTKGTWAASGTAIDWIALETSNTIDATKKAIAGARGLNLIPQEGVKVTASVKITHTTHGTVTKDVTGTLTLEKGKLHTVNVKVDPTKELASINFATPTIDDSWGTGSSNPDINN